MEEIETVTHQIENLAECARNLIGEIGLMYKLADGVAKASGEHSTLRSATSGLMPEIAALAEALVPFNLPHQMVNLDDL